MILFTLDELKSLNLDQLHRLADFYILKKSDDLDEQIGILYNYFVEDINIQLDNKVEPKSVRVLGIIKRMKEKENG